MHERTARRLTFGSIGLILLGCVAGILVPAGLGWDFSNFYDAGRRVASGQIAEIYDTSALIGGQPPQGQMRFWGTPISAVFYAPLAAFPPRAALIVFKVQNVIAYGAALGLLFLFCRRFVAPLSSARWEFAAIFAGLTLIYQPFWTVFRVGGQTTATVLLLIVGGVILHTGGRLWGSAVCMVVAALIKPALAPALLFLLCVSGLRFLRNTTIILAAVGLGSITLLGWPVHQAFLHRVLTEGRASFPWYHNSSLFIVTDSLRSWATATTGDLLVTGATWVLKAVVLATVGYLILKSRGLNWALAARRHFHFMLAVAFFLLWSPTLWEHYLAVLFPFLAYLVASRDHFSGQARALIALIFLLSLAQNLILMDWLRGRFAFDSAWQLTSIALLKSGPLWLTLVLLWRHHRELFRSYAAPAWLSIPALPVPERRAS